MTIQAKVSDQDLYYTSSAITYDIRIDKLATSITFDNTLPDSITYGNTLDIAATEDSSIAGTVSYSISTSADPSEPNTAGASVTGVGVVSVTQSGQFTAIATFTPTDSNTYAVSSPIKKTITVNKKSVAIQFEDGDQTKSIGDTTFTKVATIVSADIVGTQEATYTYTATAGTAATVVSSTGVVSIGNSTGVTTITADIRSDNLYYTSSAAATYKVTVSETDTGGASDSYDYLVNISNDQYEILDNDSNVINNLELMSGSYVFKLSDAAQSKAQTVETLEIKDSSDTVYQEVNTNDNQITLNINSQTTQLKILGVGDTQIVIIDMLPPWMGPPVI